MGDFWGVGGDELEKWENREFAKALIIGAIVGVILVGCILAFHFGGMG